MALSPGMADFLIHTCFQVVDMAIAARKSNHEEQDDPVLKQLEARRVLLDKMLAQMPERAGAESAVVKVAPEAAVSTGQARAPQPIALIRPDVQTSTRAPTLASTSQTVELVRRNLAKELYRFELDLTGGLRIAGRGCDCQPGTTLVYTASAHNGGTPSVATLGDVYKTKRKQLLNHRGKLDKGVGWLSRSYSGEMLSLKFHYTRFPLEVTPNHPLLLLKCGTWRNGHRFDDVGEGHLSWIPAQDAQTGDFIAFPRQAETVDLEIITPELAEVFGWYLAEGSKSIQDADRIVFSLGQHERHNVERLIELLRRCFGEKPKVYERPTSVHLAVSRREFTTLFHGFGTRATDKQLPSWALKLPPLKQGALLRGYLAGDGQLSQVGWAAVTSSMTLAFQLRLLLFRLGIIHGISHSQSSPSTIRGRPIVPSGPRYQIHINGDAAIALGLLMDIPWQPTGHHSPRHLGWVGDEFILLPLWKSNRVGFEGEVYNLKLAEENTYLTPHGAVHNCGQKHSMGVEAITEELVPMDPRPVYGRILDWLRQHAPEFEPTRVDQTPADYYRGLAAQVRDFRKEVLGTESRLAMLTPEEQERLQVRAKELLTKGQSSGGA